MKSRLEAAGLSLLVLYFAYHAFAGEKGLGRWSDAQMELEDRKAELASLEPWRGTSWLLSIRMKLFSSLRNQALQIDIVVLTCRCVIAHT